MACGVLFRHQSTPPTPSMAAVRPTRVTIRKVDFRTCITATPVFYCGPTGTGKQQRLNACVADLKQKILR
jgi:hypothetical protein